MSVPPLIPQAHGIPAVQPINPYRPLDARLPFDLLEPSSPLERSACETEIQMRMVQRDMWKLGSQAGQVETGSIEGDDEIAF
jgi:hypothetical protein